MLQDCLKNVGLVPVEERVLLEIEFGRITRWAVDTLRTVVVDACAVLEGLGLLPDGSDEVGDSDTCLHSVLV